MFVLILGAAAGGGLPQWNCRCPNCLAARSGSPDVRPLTQSSLAVSSDGASWFLLNVSPDVRQQIQASPQLAPPETSERGTAIAGCVLTDAELDHSTGLLLLRERSSFSIYSTSLVRGWLNDKFPVEPVLSDFGEHPWHEIEMGKGVDLSSASGETSGLRISAFELDAHPPLFVGEVSGDVSGSVIGMTIEDDDTGGKLVFAPGVESINEGLKKAVEGADLLFFDGTFWSEDEMVVHGFSERSAKDMGHMPISGSDGSLDWLKSLDVAQKVFFHINNTNPILNRCSPEYRMVEEAGIRVGMDGDQFNL